jgi:alpha-L-glutamate ligase-like protein
MFFARPSVLRQRGILGMNERNAGYISKYNPRRFYPLVDNKLKTKAAAQAQGIPVPALYGVVEYQSRVKNVAEILDPHESFVIKPAQGSGGKGILVIVGRRGDRWVKSSGQEIGSEDVNRHITNILAGLHSLGGRNDVAMIEALIDFDPDLAKYSYEGVPDIRVIAFKSVPVMAMMRCATHASDGKANLHQGAVGVGIDIATGQSVRAVQHGELVERHPDTNGCFRELQIPHWNEILELAASCVEMTGLQYLGADIVLDKVHGPVLLELNARPGLAIQVANQAGLQHRLRRAADIAQQSQDIKKRISLAQSAFGVATTFATA